MASRIVVTGAAGFIGAHIVRAAINQGNEVCAIVRPSTDLSRLQGLLAHCQLDTADVCDQLAIGTALARFRPDVVIHTAMSGGHARGAADRIESLRTSVMGTASVLEAAAAVKAKRFIHLGSFLVYEPGVRPHHEGEPLRPSTVRGSAKALASAWCGQFAATTGLAVLELRLFSVYGPLEAGHRLVPTLIAAAANNADVLLRGDPRHDWVYVEDVAEACLRACSVEPFPRGTINIGAGRHWSNSEVAHAVERVTGAHLRVVQDGHPGSPADRENCTADVTRARDLLGWTPRHSLEQGLSATLKAYARARS